MGKIHDALKRAEREAKEREEKNLLLENNTAINHTQFDDLKNQSQNIITQETIEVTQPNETLPDPMAPASHTPRTSEVPSIKKKNIDLVAPVNKALFVVNDPNSLEAEQFRHLRSRIFNLNKNNACQTILVTSTLAEEGKSTVSANLSISIASAINQYAVLIDCDLRKPTIHKLLNLNPDLGISNYLTKHTQLSPVINATRIERLVAIPAGNQTDNPTELLGSEQMKILLQDIKKRFAKSYIIIDSTPASQTPEPTILKEHVDGIILVVRSGKSKREEIRRTIETLGREKLIGVVFNMTQEPVKSYFSKPYYYSSEKSKPYD